jgi:two-component system LytT family sensor kinase
MVLKPNILRDLRNHILVWITFIVYEVLIVIIINGTLGSLTSYAFYYSINISLFYIHKYLLSSVDQQVNKNVKIGLFLFLILIELIAYIAVVMCLNNFLVILQVFKSTITYDYLFAFKSSWRAFYFIGFATGYYYIQKAIKETKRANEAENDLLLKKIRLQHNEKELFKSQNAALRNQINPHFLFNILNSIYKHTLKDSPEAANAIVSLAEIMRYAMKDMHGEQGILLTEEIEQIQNLINLYQFRSIDDFQINFAVDGEMDGIEFPPLVLMTLVENMFKHGMLKKGAGATIMLTYSGGLLRFYTENVCQINSNDVKTKIGLDNISRRLRNSFGEKAHFEYGVSMNSRFFTDIQVVL